MRSSQSDIQNMKNSSFKDIVDWSLYDKQNNAAPSQSGSEENTSNQNVSIGPKIKSIDPFAIQKSQENPFMTPRGAKDVAYKSLTDPKVLIEAGLGVAGLGTPGVKLAGKGIESAEKVIDYLQPGKAAEEFRSTLGSGTSKENIENLSKRAQFAKQSAQKEALIPKGKLYAEKGGEDVYKVNQSSLPESNLEKLGYMIAPEEKMNQSRLSALSSALKDYRKSGDVNSFMEKSEDIFNVPELNEKAAAKIEDTLSMPGKRESKYFSDESVTEPYGSRGKLMELHSAYQEKPILNNYDSLQSALKKELREAQNRAKISETAVPKVEQLQANIKNLNADKESFMQTLPENMRNLENEFRQKYKNYAETYEKGKKETGSSLTLRRLAEGRHDLLSDSDIVNLFANPTKADMKAIHDMGESSTRNALYSAMQKVKPGDAEGLANTVLDLKRTKGFDKFITKDMEDWAHKTIAHVRRAGMIKKALGSAGGAVGGSMIAGPLGGFIGGALPFTKEGFKYISKFVKK